MENEYAASGDESAGFVNYLIRQGLADRTIRIYENSVERWLIHCARSRRDNGRDEAGWNLPRRTRYPWYNAADVLNRLARCLLCPMR
jgi:hypothetical protein